MVASHPLSRNGMLEVSGLPKTIIIRYSVKLNSGKMVIYIQISSPFGEEFSFPFVLSQGAKSKINGGPLVGSFFGPLGGFADKVLWRSNLNLLNNGGGKMGSLGARDFRGDHQGLGPGGAGANKIKKRGGGDREIKTLNLKGGRAPPFIKRTTFWWLMSPPEEGGQSFAQVALWR